MNILVRPKRDFAPQVLQRALPPTMVRKIAITVQRSRRQKIRPLPWRQRINRHRDSRKWSHKERWSGRSTRPTRVESQPALQNAPPDAQATLFFSVIATRADRSAVGTIPREDPLTRDLP